MHSGSITLSYNSVSSKVAGSYTYLWQFSEYSIHLLCQYLVSGVTKKLSVKEHRYCLRIVPVLDTREQKLKKMESIVERKGASEGTLQTEPVDTSTEMQMLQLNSLATAMNSFCTHRKERQLYMDEYSRDKKRCVVRYP